MTNGFTSDEIKEMFYSILRIRLIEEAIADRYHTKNPEDQKMRCPVHLSIGQEAVPVGVCAELRRDDQITLTHRCHAQYLAKGGDLDAMIAEMYGRTTGCCGGRGGSMHLYDDKAGILVSYLLSLVPYHLELEQHWAMQQTRQKSIAVSFFGDGASEEGVFHESMNFASLKNLPIIFVLENNLYSVYTGLKDRQPSPALG